MRDTVIGAKLALFLGERLVVIHRDDIPTINWPGYWDLPGGGREGAETPLECALRETREEVSLVIDPGLVNWGRPYPTSSGHTAWFFAAHAEEALIAQIALGDEGQGWDMWTREDFLAHQRAVPQFKPRLRDYLNGVESAEFVGSS